MLQFIDSAEFSGKFIGFDAPYESALRILGATKTGSRLRSRQSNLLLFVLYHSGKTSDACSSPLKQKALEWATRLANKTFKGKDAQIARAVLNDLRDAVTKH